VAFTVRKHDERSESLVNEIAAMGGTAKAYAADAASFTSASEVVAEVMKDFGRIDILVNNAGITKDGLLMRMTEEQWDMVINTNLKSAFNYIHALTPIMMKQRSGSIINMTSIVGISGNAGQANYSASKAGMIGLTKSVAKELGSRGVRVNAIAPGFIATEMTGVLNEDTKKQWILNIPLRREGKVEDVAGVAVFLASDLASYVSGQVINCCGGLNM
jgi:3-oxoacyl-[acyl-carrier protein] reductase